MILIKNPIVEYKNINQIRKIYFYLYIIKYIQYKLQTFVYDSLGRRTSLSMPNGTTTSYSYDTLNRFTNLSTLNSALSTINSFTYTYDSVGNKLSKQDSAGINNYTYDNTYQLINATHPNIPQETFTYDQVGNRTNTTVDAANKLLQDPNATYQYDANGNRYVKTQTDGTIIYYSYDYEGRLTRVETQKPGLTTIAVYKYDPLGRRFEKAVDGVVTRYLYSSEGLIAEYDINNNLKKTYGWMPNAIWGTDPLYMTENNQTYFYHNDALGTPQKMTDASGAVVWSAAYTSFGESTIDPSSTITSNLRFAGQYFDQETGLHYNLNRYYDPSTGKYMTKDPIGFDAGDVNLYRYVFNSPINYIDPWGLEIQVCVRPVSGGPLRALGGIHAYLYDDTSEKTSGTSGSSGSGDEVIEHPKNDKCNVVKGSKGKEKKVMKKMDEIRNKGLYIPGILDCHQKASKAVESEGLVSPGAPGGRLKDDDNAISKFQIPPI